MPATMGRDVERRRRSTARCKHLGRIVGDLVDIARITRRTLELRRERLELAPILERAVETCRGAIDAAGQHLDLSVPETPIELDADPVRLAQLFGNLLANASKYSAQGTRIGLAAHRQGSEVVVSVSDEGVGIAPEAQSAIFDMFARGSSNGQDGLGVGLTLAQHLAQLHGGSIEVRSDGTGRGSEFRVHLPIFVGSGRRPGNGGAEPEPYVGHRILVIDDNRDAADALASLLELEGNEAHVAHDGIVALEAAGALRPDVMLVDIGLPGLNGYEVAARIRQEPWGASVLLVALTGWGHPEDRARSEEAGFDYHLVKPVELAVLTELLATPRFTADRLRPSDPGILRRWRASPSCSPAAPSRCGTIRQPPATSRPCVATSSSPPFPACAEIAEIEPIDWGLVPASHLSFDQVLEIGGILADQLGRPDIDGAVVVQGTDVIEETAFAWDLLPLPDQADRRRRRDALGVPGGV